MAPPRLTVENVVENGWLVKVAYPGYLEKIESHVPGKTIPLDATYHVFMTVDPEEALARM